MIRAGVVPTAPGRPGCDDGGPRPAVLRREALRTLADHEKRLTRLETMVEIARPGGATSRIAPQPGRAGE